MPLMRVQRSSSPPAGGGVPATEAVAAREEGLSLVARVNRWMIGLAVILAGALTGLTAHAFHAKAASPHSATTAPSPSANGGSPPANGGNSAPLQSPSSAPAPAAPAPAPAAPVVSGGS
jgi:hypothetical protein